MAVTVLPVNATNKKLQYTTSDNNVATVDNKGLLLLLHRVPVKLQQRRWMEVTEAFL